MATPTDTWAILEAEYRAKAGSSKPEDVIRCRSIQRELAQLTTQFLEEHDGARIRRRSGNHRTA
jgi:hypothetical protein